MNQFEKCLIHLCLLPIALINSIQKLIITNIEQKTYTKVIEKL